MVLFPTLLAFVAFISVGASKLREATDEEFPFQVSIQTMDRRHLCGGAIITPKWVLTVKPCVEGHRSVKISYGSADSNTPDVLSSQNIIVQNEFSFNKKNTLALIELEKPLEFSKTVKQAGLPTAGAEMRNTTKLSGWKVSRTESVPPNLYVNDVYYLIEQNCKSSSGMPVNLAEDEFCGMDEDNSGSLFNPGCTVSKSAIVLGILANPPLALHQPSVFVKLSEHEQWIRESLRTDAKDVNWADKIPKDSAPSNSAISLALIGISAIFLRFI